MSKPRADLSSLTETQEKAPRRRRKAASVEKPKMMQDLGVEAYSHMPVSFGNVKAQVFGGPFREYVPGQRRVVSVKMAAEVDHPHDISIPTRDFSTPRVDDLHAGLDRALQAILDGNDLYVGCMGGIGRTGLFMACLAKVMMDYCRPGAGDVESNGLPAPVVYVRKHYYAHAVETDSQKEFIRAFDTSTHVAYLRKRLNPEPAVVVKTVTKEVPVYVFNPFKAFLQFWGLDKQR